MGTTLISVSPPLEFIKVYKFAIYFLGQNFICFLPTLHSFHKVREERERMISYKRDRKEGGQLREKIVVARKSVGAREGEG